MTKQKNVGGRPRGFTPGALKRTTQIGVWRWNDELLWQKIEKTDNTDECWFWTGADSPHAALFGVSKGDHPQMTQARRIVYMSYYKEDIADHSVYSTCHTHSCVSPHHMQLKKKL